VAFGLFPTFASAATNPGTVDLSSSLLSYTARSGEQNNVTLIANSNQITLRDTNATNGSPNLVAGTGCAPGQDAHEVVCQLAGGLSFSSARYDIETGDLDDTVTIAEDATSLSTGPFSSGSINSISGTIDGGTGDDTLNGGRGSDVLIG